ncbi:lytic transglycosylase domain-containing protein [Falsirhodobacter sp. 1013]|uniref:lytic transglycosylase domain-containing protein n=1 Tax=Falsirhodobacter sp. 1013 TaxID=3417566 RepID=UPI003EC0BCD0
MSRPILILATLCLTVGAASADVFEFLPDGTMVQRGLPEVSAAPGPAVSRRSTAVPASRAQYRALAEDVALAHAGGPGPRAAGLDALTFQRVFVALVRQESGFNPRAVSPVGAQGLGQLMPATARQLGVTDAFDPHQNLNGAARYFAQQLARFKDVRLALAAYNAGPHRVEHYGGIPPFPETRNYVASITAATGLHVPAADPASVTPVAEVLTPSPDTQRSISVWQY